MWVREERKEGGGKGKRHRYSFFQILALHSYSLCLFWKPKNKQWHSSVFGIQTKSHSSSVRWMAYLKITFLEISSVSERGEPRQSQAVCLGRKGSSISPKPASFLIHIPTNNNTLLNLTDLPIPKGHTLPHVWGKQTGFQLLGLVLLLFAFLV